MKQMDYGEDDYERLDRAFSELSDSQREIIVLSRYQGLKYGEISAIINQSVPAIKGGDAQGHQTVKKNLYETDLKPFDMKCEEVSSFNNRLS